MWRISFIVFLISLVSVQSANAQVQLYEYFEVDQLPQYQNGIDFKSDLYASIEWPEPFHGEGNVFLSFVINSKGEIGSIRVIRGLCIPCDQNAASALQSFSSWIPGKRDGQSVATRMYVNIEYRFLANEKRIKSLTDGVTNHPQFFEIVVQGNEAVKIDLFSEDLNKLVTIVDTTFAEYSVLVLGSRKSISRISGRYDNPHIIPISYPNSGIYELKLKINGQLVESQRFMYIP